MVTNGADRRQVFSPLDGCDGALCQRGKGVTLSQQVLRGETRLEVDNSTKSIMTT